MRGSQRKVRIAGHLFAILTVIVRIARVRMFSTGRLYGDTPSQLMTLFIAAVLATTFPPVRDFSRESQRVVAGHAGYCGERSPLATAATPRSNSSFLTPLPRRPLPRAVEQLCRERGSWGKQRSTE